MIMHKAQLLCPRQSFKLLIIWANKHDKFFNKNKNKGHASICFIKNLMLNLNQKSIFQKS
jgi:hypothetical protein